MPDDGLGFPPCGADELATVLRPRQMGGALAADGLVEVVSSLRRNGRPVERDLRWGVYVVFKAESDYAAACFKQYGMPTDPSGRYAAMYKPFHLIGLETSISVLNVALRGEPTGSCRGFRGDAVAVAKRALKAGETLDGEGGYTVYAKLIPAARSLSLGALPIGLAHHVKLLRDVAAGEFVQAADVTLDDNAQAVRVRREMEREAREDLLTERNTANSKLSARDSTDDRRLGHGGSSGPDRLIRMQKLADCPAAQMRAAHSHRRQPRTGIDVCVGAAQRHPIALSVRRGAAPRLSLPPSAGFSRYLLPRHVGPHHRAGLLRPCLGIPKTRAGR